MRVFLALDIPEDVRGRIARLVAEVQPAVRGARWARVESMHVTLKFIGEAAPEKLARIQETLEEVSSPAAVEMQFRNAGFFPDGRRPRVFWAGIEATANLAGIAAEIERRLEPLGIPRETRPFRPHLTLARFDSQAGVPELRRALQRLGPFEFGSARAGEFHLYRSHLKPGGAEYERLRTFAFAGKEP